MEWEVRVVGGDGVFGFEFSNAPGAQIAPGSDEVREDLQDGRIGHGRKVPPKNMCHYRLIHSYL